MPYVRPKPAGAATSSTSAASTATATNGTGNNSGSSSDAATLSPSISATTSSGLGTSWDAVSVEQQLRELGVADEAVLVGDPLPLSPPPTSAPTTSNGSTSSSMVVQAIGRGNAGSPAAAPAMSSRRAMKQALFQLSDAEDEGDGGGGGGGNDGEMEAVQSQQAHHDTGDYLAKLRAARGDPMRRSISAMSGVTVIGRGGGGGGAPSMHREGSSSTLGSQRESNGGRGGAGGRSSLDEQRQRAGRSSIDEEDAAEVFAKPPPSSSPPPPPSAAGPSSSAEVGQKDNHLDLSTALNLLSNYPRSTSPARNRVIDAQDAEQPPSYGAGVGEADPRASGASDVPPPFTRSASAGEVPATTTEHQPPLVPYHSSGASSPSFSHHHHHPRRHSRSSIHERDRISPGFALSPIHGAAELPPHSHQQLSSSTISPSLSRELSLASSYQFPGPHRSEGLASPPEFSRSGKRTPPGSSSALFSNTYSLQSSMPTSSTSPRHAHRPETAGGRLSRSTNRSRRGSAKSPEFHGPACGPPPPTASSSRRPSSARSSSTSDLSQIMRTFSGKPRRSGTLSRQNTQDNLTAMLAEEVGVEEAVLAASLRRSGSQKSAGGGGASVSVAELKHLIQQKRRQASAPFHSLASVSIPPSQIGSPVLPGSGAQSPVLALQPGQYENGHGSVPGRQPWEVTPPRRARSRHATMGGVNGSLTLSLSTNGFEEARLRAMRGMGEVVMTPSIEEWRQLGLNESLNDRDSGSSSGSETDEENSTGSTSEEDTALSETEGDAYGMAGRNDTTPRPRIGSISRIGRYNGSAPPPHAHDLASQLCSLSEEERQAEVGDEHATPLKRSSHSGITRVASTDGGPHSTAMSLAKSPKLRHGDGRERERRRKRDSAGNHSGDISTTSETDESLDLDLEMERRMSQRSSGSIPTLSRQSLSATTGTPTPGNGHGGSGTPIPSQASASLQPMDAATMRLANGVSVAAAPSPLTPSSPAPAPSNTSSPLIAPPSPSRASSPLPLTAIGPIDPRAYSAVTGMRTVDSFVVQGEAGKGAYGLVRRVREKGPDGKAVGPDMMLKYIVKQRILADAYKRHKVLGAIPMEIHVLDFVRRVQRLGANPASPRDPLSAVAAFKASLGLSPSPGSSPLPHAPPTTAASANAQQQYAYGHPSLCQMLDFFEDAENYYLVMACFGEGQDLFDYVDAAPNGLELGESRTILRQIVDAVAFLHSHGIVHRDIKDENIILDGQGGVQLIDFGSAAYVREGKPYFDTFSGTLDFASPEVLRGERYGGKETDIWALGVLGYVVLCGECPFWSSEESLSGLEPGTRAEEALQTRAMEAEADLPPEASPDQFASHARDAVDLIHQCLAVHSRDRPSAVQLQGHRFLRDDGRGWTGHRGWELRLSDSASGSGSESDSA